MSNTYYGKYEGIVEDNQDPLNLLRVKVRVPAVLGDQVSDWAFPCVPYGGRKDVGDFNPPEEGTKVWVEFKGGNPAYPIWTGHFWSQPGGESEVPDGVDDKHRKIKTSSGHLIEIVDEAGQEMIKVTTQGGHEFLLSDETDTGDSETDSDNKRLRLRSALGHLFEIIDVSGSEEILFQTNAGHKVSMVDVSGSEKILIQDKDGNQILMDTVNTQMVLKMAEILLGDGATEPAVLGNALMTLYNGHNHPGDSGGTTGVPNQQMSSSQLSSTVKVKG